MKREVTAVDILFPKIRAAVLKRLFTLPPRRIHVRELARRTGMALSTIQQELHNLAMLGIVTSSTDGYHRHYAANSSHALFQPLLEIVQMSDKLPAIARGGMYRADRRRKQKRPAVRPLPPNRPMHWQIFKPRRQT
jgi:DNA-binding transcriptional ArsR family regulator